MTGEELELLAELVAEKLSKRISLAPKTSAVQPYLVTRQDLDVILRCGRNSTTTRDLLKDPKFPSPIEMFENGRQKWRYKDVINYIENRFSDQSRMLFEIKSKR